MSLMNIWIPFRFGVLHRLVGRPPGSSCANPRLNSYIRVQSLPKSINKSKTRCARIGVGRQPQVLSMKFQVVELSVKVQGSLGCERGQVSDGPLTAVQRNILR